VLTGLVAAALVAVVALGGWVRSWSHQRARQLAEQQVGDLLTAPDARVYAAELTGANMSYVVSRERNQALFLAPTCRPRVPTSSTGCGRSGVTRPRRV
jgi:hypothetical protein